jgi:dTDP-4-amino-4,6-dideoxygalactose transaminase
MGGMGDGGIIVTQSEALALHLRTMRNHGSLNGEDPLQLGWNSRLDEIQAAILQIKLKYIEQWNLRRRHLARLYHQGLKGCGLRLPIPSTMEDSTFQNYTLCTPRRDQIHRALGDHGIGTMIYYPKPLYQIPSVQSLLKHPVDPLPETERACREALSLPLYPELTEAEVETVCQVIGDVTR